MKLPKEPTSRENSLNEAMPGHGTANVTLDDTKIGTQNGTSNRDEQSTTDYGLEREKVTFLACFLGAIASIGGLIFGYIRFVSNHLFFYSASLNIL